MAGFAIAGFLFDLLTHGFIALFITILNIISFISSLFYEYFLAKQVTMNKTNYAIVITGCDSGFGEMASRKLSSLGFHVISGCITNDGVERLSSSVAIAMICDVTKETDVNQLVQKTEEYLTKKNIKLWAIVNNAGIGNSGAFDWIPIQTIRKVMDVNFFGVVNITKGFLPLLKQTKNSRIVNLSSIAGFSSAPLMGAYAASKHAVEGLMKSVRAELMPWNIHVVNINPGFFRTPIVTNNSSETLKTFTSLPTEIKSQYDENLFVPSESIMALLEDPVLVVDAIVKAVSYEYVPMWIFPGVQAGYINRHITSLTDGIMNKMAIGSQSLFPNPKPEILKSLQGE